jgi:hypothetical protein
MTLLLVNLLEFFADVVLSFCCPLNKGATTVYTTHNVLVMCDRGGLYFNGMLKVLGLRVTTLLHFSLAMHSRLHQKSQCMHGLRME